LIVVAAGVRVARTIGIETTLASPWIRRRNGAFSELVASTAVALELAARAFTITLIGVTAGFRVARTIRTDTALGKLTMSVSPGSRGWLHESGSVCDDEVAFSKANYGKEDGVASEGGGQGHHDFVVYKDETK